MLKKYKNLIPKTHLKLFWGAFLILSILLLAPIISAELYYDNIKGDLIIDETTSKYGSIEIKDWFGLLSLAKLELKENTDTCGSSCSAETEIILYQDSVLIDDVKFVGAEVNNPKFYIQTGTRGTGVFEDIYNRVCSNGKTLGNGTIVQNCIIEKIKGNEILEPIWEEYILGTEVIAGTYKIKLEGEKDFYSSTDWIITTQGKEIIEWADWGAGGTITYDGGYTIHTFFTNGTFTPSTANIVSVLVVGGGGSGSPAGAGGGAGGGGGVIMNYTWNLTAPSYAVVVGSGGAGWADVEALFYNPRLNGGSNSSFGSLIAMGGGAGSSDNIAGQIGGSGGGGNGGYGTTGGASSSGQGNNGGNGQGSPAYSGGGGGGHSAVGENAPSAGVGGDGGVGTAYTINGSSVYYGCGGGGGTYGAGGGGGEVAGQAICGQGNATVGGKGNGFDGADYTGAGGGGTGPGNGAGNTTAYSGSGGDGVVIIRYPSNYTVSSVVTTTLNSPIDYYNSTSNSITFNCSANTTSTDGEYITNISLWLNITGTWILNETTDFVSGSENSIQLTKNIPDGINYKWTCRAYDNSSNYDWATNRSFSIDTIFPQVTINQPTGTKSYGYEGYGETLNWTVVDSNLASVWYNYNGTNYTLTGAINTTTFYLKTSPFNLTLWTNDSVGNTNKSTTTWSYLIFETGQTYVPYTYEGVSNTFVLNFTHTSADWSVVTGSLTYNGTNYSGTKTGSGDNLVFTANVNAPQVNVKQNISFYWSIALTNVSGTTTISSSTYQQTVNITNMSLCGNPLPTTYLNFTCYDETTYTVINCTTSTTFDYQISGANYFETFSYSNASSVTGTTNFCFYPPSETFTVNSIMEYSATGYASRYYNFEGIDFTNTTTAIPLYLLGSSNSTSFIVEVQDSNYQPLADVEVYMQKYRTDIGAWVTVEIATTNDDGETVAHIYTEDSIYRFKIYDDGTLIHTSTGSVIACPSTPCTVTITISEPLTPVIPIFEDLDNLETSLTYSKTTEVISYTYSDTSGNFSKSRLFVIRSNPGVPDITYTCNETSSSSSAVLTCDLTGAQNGTYIATGFITRLATAERMVERKAIQKIKDIVGVIGLEGVLWSMFLFIGILMLGVYRPSLGIIFGIVGLILISYLQLMQLSITAIIAVVGIGVILLLEARKQ